ncbi:MAG: hypothetical protein ACRYFS_03640 [Janthinobacterium lividum]
MPGSTIIIRNAHSLTESEIDILYPEGPMRDAARAAVAEAAGVRRFVPAMPCTECLPCQEAARLKAQQETEALSVLAEAVYTEDDHAVHAAENEGFVTGSVAH